MARFYHYMQIRFEKPRYTRIDKIPFIPSQLEVDQLIAGVGKKMSTFLRLLSETGMRVGGAWNLKWTDIDCERGVVNVTPEKGSNAKQLKISTQLNSPVLLKHILVANAQVSRASAAGTCMSRAVTTMFQD